MFLVPDDQVAREAGEDVLDAARSGKLVDFLDWLYGSAEAPFDPRQLQIRLAPSIITRSESELLVLSSPRFAFRAYYNGQGFVTIRRRKISDRQIRSTLTSDCVLHLVGASFDEESNWIADCLLELPPRLQHYDVLTCDLAEDYGESAATHLTPFVTHVSFGGGLCAQAACFMALCLIPKSRLLGIAEITSEAMKTPGHSSEAGHEDAFAIRGLNAHRVASFFNQSGNRGVSAQLQIASLEDACSALLIAKALKTYIRNRIPVIQIVSLSRMLGIGLVEEGQLKPVLRLAKGPANHQDYHRIPIGIDQHGRLPDATDGDSVAHCVVIVGCSENAFLINDPATFPFLECTVDQIVNICAYESPGPDGTTSEARFVIDESDLPTGGGSVQSKAKARPPQYFEAISVTDDRVSLPLLDPEQFVASESSSVVDVQRHKVPKGDAPMLDKRYGLFEAVNVEMQFQTRFRVSPEQDPAVANPFIPALYGDFYLVATNKQGEIDFAGHSLPKPVIDSIRGIVSSLPTDRYWMHHVQVNHPSFGAQSVDSLWFWSASRMNVCARACLQKVAVELNGVWQWFDVGGRE